MYFNSQSGFIPARERCMLPTPARLALSNATLDKKMLFAAIARRHCGLNNINLSCEFIVGILTMERAKFSFLTKNFFTINRTVKMCYRTEDKSYP